MKGRLINSRCFSIKCVSFFLLFYHINVRNSEFHPHHLIIFVLTHNGTNTHIVYFSTFGTQNKPASDPKWGLQPQFCFPTDGHWLVLQSEPSLSNTDTLRSQWDPSRLMITSLLLGIFNNRSICVSEGKQHHNTVIWINKNNNNNNKQYK